MIEFFDNKIFFMRKCDMCGSPAEERVFTDSWTGKELCVSCLYGIIGKVIITPQSEEDNLLVLMDCDDE